MDRDLIRKIRLIHTLGHVYGENREDIDKVIDEKYPEDAEILKELWRYFEEIW